MRGFPHAPSLQQGAALVSVIFLIVVVGILGAFAIRTGADQQQMSMLALTEARVDAAAFTGLEYVANHLKYNRPSACPAVMPLPNIPEMNRITVTLQCSASVFNGVGTVHDVTATAVFGTFGNADRVQRVRTRRMSNIGVGSWQ